jgi:capsular polysaccharide export protein
VGFNGGDRLFWRDRARFIAFDGPLETWEATLGTLLERHGITDVVLYGEVRPVHATAIRVAKARGLGCTSSRKATCGPGGPPTSARAPTGGRR